MDESAADEVCEFTVRSIVTTSMEFARGSVRGCRSLATLRAARDREAGSRQRRTLMALIDARIRNVMKGLPPMEKLTPAESRIEIAELRATIAQLIDASDPHSQEQLFLSSGAIAKRWDTSSDFVLGVIKSGALPARHFGKPDASRRAWRVRLEDLVKYEMAAPTFAELEGEGEEDVEAFFNKQEQRKRMARLGFQV